MSFRALSLAILVGLWSVTAHGAALTFTDPAGDDFGPGTYTYPTDSVYAKGTFDLRKLEVIDKGSKVEFHVTLGTRITDPWDSKDWPEPGNGFSLQMVQIYIDTDAKAGSGHTQTLPGINGTFASEDAWDKVVLISPQATSRLKSEVKTKAAALKDAVVIPKKTRAKGKKLVAVVKKKDLGGAPAASWGVQVVVQSNEGYPAAGDLLSRKVNEYEGQHRFGGGNDYDCDPHVLDILVSPAKGETAESEAQKAALAYTCGPEGEAVKPAVLPMVRATR